MGSDRPTHQLTAEDKSALLAAGMCPFCMGQQMNPDGRLTRKQETLVDHCLHLFGDKHPPCKQGWLVCEACLAYGNLDNFVDGG